MEAVMSVLLLAGPLCALLGVALVVGLVVSLIQAATQLNEMTLSFVPKVLAMGLAGVFAGPWMLHVMMISPSVCSRAFRISSAAAES